jgi:NADPH-dependent curcumin reductase CurA
MTENRFWRLNARPVGDDYAAALSLESETLPSPAAGEVLIRNDYLSMDAGVRMWMTPRTDGYNPPIPLGAKMMGLSLGRVVLSRADGFKPGDLVRCFGQWAEYSLVRPELSNLVVLDETVSDVRQHFGALGMNAWTAYGGLVDFMKIRPRETVVVSAAAGATGSLACQIARNLGCTVIGIAGSADKTRFLTEELGINRAINYKTQDVEAELAKIEGGINVYFENVGGPILDAVLPNMALHGRIAVSGLIAGYKGDKAAPGPARFDQVLMKRLTIVGIFLPDYMDRWVNYYPVLRNWMDEGKLTVAFDATRGIENTLVAFKRMMTGNNSGKVIVDVRP